MQMMQVDGHTICAPDHPILGMTLATIVKDWIAIGAIGDGHGLLLDSEEWPAFVQFVKDLDEVMYANHP